MDDDVATEGIKYDQDDKQPREPYYRVIIDTMWVEFALARHSAEELGPGQEGKQIYCLKILGELFEDMPLPQKALKEVITELQSLQDKSPYAELNASLGKIIAALAERWAEE